MSDQSALLAAGLSPTEAARKATVFENVAAAHAALAGRAAAPARRYFVPGRIEVLGKHTDYAGGRSLLCAVERGFCLVASPRQDRRVVVADAGRGLRAQVALDLDDAANAPPAGHWTVYLEAVARRIARNFPGSLAGADIAFASDLPRASGLSSSSALVVALFSALSDINRLEDRPEYRQSIQTREDLGVISAASRTGRRSGTCRATAASAPSAEARTTRRSSAAGAGSSRNTPSAPSATSSRSPCRPP